LSGQPRQLLQDDRSESWVRTLTPAETGTHFTDNWKPESSLPAPGIEPRPSRSTWWSRGGDLNHSATLTWGTTPNYNSLIDSRQMSGRCSWRRLQKCNSECDAAPLGGSSTTYRRCRRVRWRTACRRLWPRDFGPLSTVLHWRFLGRLCL